MAGYLPAARHHAEEIERLYEHAGTNGYAQAVFHWNELATLCLRAERSKRHKNDAPLINAIRNDVKLMMEEMKHRQKGGE